MAKSRAIKRSTQTGIVTSKANMKQWLKSLQADLGGRVSDVKRLGSVYLLVDCSSSMEVDNKLDQAKKGAIAFSKEASTKGYDVGLIRFASFAEHLCEPRRKPALLWPHIESMAASGSTNMADAVRLAKDELTHSLGRGIMYIITDGMPDNRIATLYEARKAKEKGIDIMTLGTDDADVDFLRELASRTELAAKVSRDQLEGGIASASRMLPGVSTEGGR